MPFGQILFFLILVAVPLSGTATDLDKAVDLRKTEQFSKAEQLLKKYSSPAKFDSLNPTEKIEFLCGLLELAHIRALKDDVPGALALLNWAEGRKDPYQRAIACIKYAEILLDLGEFERSSAYLKNADEIIRNRAAEEDTGAAIGQGGVVADSGAVWRDLRDNADVLRAEIEAETLKKKFGASYGNCVKLRHLQVLLKRSRTPRYMKEAMRLADELMEIDPASQFAAAAGYLKGEIMASRLKEESPNKEIKTVKEYLDKFVRQQPDGLYRGEALMLLGKISLEIEWNAKDAEKYYSQALNWFRKAREKRDAMSLYASMSDDLKKQSTPTQKPTTLNQWKRIVYHDEDPLKLYNTANAPAWYMDDKEKNCLFQLGFVAFLNENYDLSYKMWSIASKLDTDIMKLAAKNWPNILMRLSDAAKFKTMTFPARIKKLIKAEKYRIKIQTAEFYYILEQFENMKRIYQNIISDPAADNYSKALSFIGIGLYSEMTNRANDFRERKNLASNYQRAMSLAKNTPIEEEALVRMAFYYQAGSETYAEGNKLIQEYLRRYPKGEHVPIIRYREGMMHIFANDISSAHKVLNILQRQYPHSPCTLALSQKINDPNFFSSISRTHKKR